MAGKKRARVTMGDEGSLCGVGHREDSGYTPPPPRVRWSHERAQAREGHDLMQVSTGLFGCMWGTDYGGRNRSRGRPGRRS